MPIVEVKMWEGRSKKKKAEIIKRVTDVLCDTLGISTEHVTVIIHEVPKHNWGMKGKPSSN